MLEVATGLFIVKSKIVKMRIYEKDGKIRVAITMDTTNKDESTVFSDQMKDSEEAKTFINNIAHAISQ